MLDFIKKRKAGFVAIESVIAMSFFIMFFFLALGFFLFIHPQTMVGREVHALATLAERQGGLTNEDITNFSVRLEEGYSFIDEGSTTISLVSLKDDVSYIRDDLFDEIEPIYSSREDVELMRLSVTTPSNNEILSKVAKFFSSGKNLEKYAFSEVIYSERY